MIGLIKLFTGTDLTNFESIYESIIYKEIKKKLFTIRANNNKVFTAFRLFKEKI